MSLEEYYVKRDFKQVPKPEKSKEVLPEKLLFVIQRLQATTLHFDFRLEIEGVLKSRSVPKGISMNPTDKRLAMLEEEHPFSYRTFEGDIPKSNYGAGHVEIWDQGIYYVPGTSDKRNS